MKFVILEDEKPAYTTLSLQLKSLMPDVWIYPQLRSVEEAISFFKQELPFHLVFSDIHLQDGTSFEVFEQIAIRAPIVFVTAYDTYLMNAFEHNGIAYLLKPVNELMLQKTLEKYNELKFFFETGNKPFNQLIKENNLQRIVVKRGTDFQLLAVDDIAYFFTKQKLVFAVDRENRKFICDESNLSDINTKLDSKHFFRANRQHVINIKFIERFYPDEQSRIVVKMQNTPAEQITVSQENAASFRKWIGKLS